MLGVNAVPPETLVVGNHVQIFVGENVTDVHINPVALDCAVEEPRLERGQYDCPLSWAHTQVWSSGMLS